jgi:hypothetical protein
MTAMRTTITTSSKAKPVTVAPSVVVRSPAFVKIESFNGLYVELEVTALPMVGDHVGRLACSKLTVQQLPEGQPVTGEALRAIPVARLTKLAIGSAMGQQGEGAFVMRVLTDEKAAELRDGGPTDEALSWVAHLYRLALVASEPPTKSVQMALGLTRSTTDRWVNLARQRGFLGAAEGPGKAGG